MCLTRYYLRMLRSDKELFAWHSSKVSFIPIKIMSVF